MSDRPNGAIADADRVSVEIVQRRGKAGEDGREPSNEHDELGRSRQALEPADQRTAGEEVHDRDGSADGAFRSEHETDGGGREAELRHSSLHGRVTGCRRRDRADAGDEIATELGEAPVRRITNISAQ